MAAQPHIDDDARAADAPRRIWLCADDYGISASVDTAIRDLIARGRLNATSVMVTAPGFNRSEAAALNVLRIGSGRVAVGLHLTLTAPFRPLSAGFQPLSDGAFMPFGQLLLRGALRLLRPEALADETAAQLEAFTAAFGRPPDFVDGHQHVQLFPQVRDAVLEVAKAMVPKTWVRQCGRVMPLTQRFADRKGLLLDALSRGFRRRAAKLGIGTNPAFAGTYDFAASRDPDYVALFGTFLDGLPDSSVIMCHPGLVDTDLVQLDSLTALREREYAFLASDAFPALLRAHGVDLA